MRISKDLQGPRPIPIPLLLPGDLNAETENIAYVPFTVVIKLEKAGDKNLDLRTVRLAKLEAPQLQLHVYNPETHMLVYERASGSGIIGERLQLQIGSL